MSKLATLWVQLSDRLWCSAASCDTREATEIRGSENDRVIIAPASLALARRIAQRDGRTSVGIHFFELPVGEETDRSPIRGKERRLGSVGSRERQRLRLVQPPHGKLRFYDLLSYDEHDS